jgi:NADPH:quinone reductase-like Zn-dependent oxidoreductase
VDHDTIPMCDGAGEVVATGHGVTRFKVGDRVAGTFFSKLGSTVRLTVMCRRWALRSTACLLNMSCSRRKAPSPSPQNLSFDEAATLPCAGVTAWNAVMVAGRPVKPGETVLCMGTGGVSIFAMQFARAAGTRVITGRLPVMISWRARANWARPKPSTTSARLIGKKEVLKLTDGRGVDHIIEVGGAGTLARIVRSGRARRKDRADRRSRHRDWRRNPIVMMLKGASMNGIYVGNRAMFEQMNRAIEVNGIKPVVDQDVCIRPGSDAWRTLASGDFFGKIVIRI